MKLRISTQPKPERESGQTEIVKSEVSGKGDHVVIICYFSYSRKKPGL